MSRLTLALTANADKNIRLLSTLAATDYAPPSLKQNIGYISDLERQIASTDDKLSRLHIITEDERKVLKEQMGEQQHRLRAREGEVTKVGNVLEEARKGLQRVRAEAFGTGSGRGREVPPAYS
ncbi:hypothetical protein DOTSEDRAFT_20918 [Dothistroma septosporum NZE10]|uniref:Uncharacterized protein n=1 Tax=Dothistroma septosporum (strain NZE10 / CBS 128990) TaxID=675120 RepID=N1PY52_DOTSN|nr:hypothetical protein DOTSEDRAFT_20918 [Dothistroma septosporum NZE10]